MTKPLAYIPTDWQLLKFDYDDKGGRVYRVEQRILKDGTIEQRKRIERS